ncbi:MAG: acyl-CoA/acyl-ACP dehydrogenase [Deltaproteobacteria bacterium]|nr:acyl-CoA/acyl-ACP dehydrogenase [Deltaproteobacteria bacterium]
MDLNLVRQELQKLLKEKLVPIALECDEKGEFPIEVYNAVADAGYGSIYLPEEYGGGGSLDGLLVVMEEFSKISPAFALSTMSSFQLFGYNIAHLGTPQQKEKYLKPLIQDRKIGCWALTEPDVGSDAVHVKTTSKRDGDFFIVNGSKTFITNAPIADFFIVIANSGGKGFDSGNAFILEKGMQGLSVSKPFKKHGHRSSPTGQVYLDQVRVPKENLLGTEHKAFYDMKHSLDIERLMVGPMIMGTLKTLIEKSVIYAYSRQQFGQPILTFQLIQEKIARMRMHLEMVTAATEKAVHSLKQGHSIKSLATALKLYAAKVGVEMASEAVQIHGGNGYTHEYGVEMFLRDAKLLEIGGGTSEMMLQILAKDTIKDVGKKFGVI